MQLDVETEVNELKQNNSKLKVPRSPEELYDAWEQAYKVYDKRLINSVSRAKYLQSVMHEEEKADNECPVCTDQITIGVLTECGHQFCKWHY